MNYIVIDLEWNQSPDGSKIQKKTLPFEIIEIGAVKLDEKYNIIDEFSQIIKPQVYEKIHYKTKEITHMNVEELNKGKDFKTTIKEFFNWCGINIKFCTWGDLDLMELQRNMEYYNIHGYIDKPIIFYDLQKIFGIMTEGRKNSKSLEYAVDYFKINKDKEFHRAVCDAKYTALIMQKLDKNLMKKYYSIDCYHNPKTKEQEIHIIYDTYSKDILREFSTKEEMIRNKDVRSTVCYKCGKRACKKIRWYSDNNNKYYCLSLCKEHGLLKGRMKIKKSKDGKFYIIKILKLVNEEEGKDIFLKREILRKRKKEKK